jgi:protein-S-isoprenylcysteine O-methyltransferase Ste14
MMVRIGNFLFHYRNGLFPIALILLLLWPGPRIFASDLLAVGVGVAVALVGQLLRAVTIGLAYIKRGGKDRQVYAETLVVEGVFAHCRNPLYLGNLTVLAGVGLAANSLLFMAIGMPFFIFAYLAIIAAEENYLRQKFGQQFIDYCARVNRLLPNFAGFKATLHEMEFHWRRLIVKEYGSTFAWTAGETLLATRNLILHGGYRMHHLAVWLLSACFLVVVVAYAVARYLKKTRLLVAD